MLTSLTSTISSWYGAEIPMWVFAIFVFIVYCPLVWIRRIEPLAKVLIFAAAMILLGVTTTAAFALSQAEQ